MLTDRNFILSAFNDIMFMTIYT